jgi:hypothetical protein
MSASPIDDLIGLRLTSHEPVEDYVQLSFEEGAAILSIYNRYEVRGPEPELGQGLGNMMGRRLIGVATGPDFVEFTFEQGSSVVVDLRDDAYTGPEAMHLLRSGRATVVWR